MNVLNSMYENHIIGHWFTEFFFFISISDNHEKTKVARASLEYITNEIGSIKKCGECYLNANKYPSTWFTMVCTLPRTKVSGYFYWPAKVMLVIGQQVNVRFFREHSYADVPAENRSLYSVTSPKKPRVMNAQYNDALKVSRF